MKTSRVLLVVALAGLCSMSAGAAAAWWLLKPQEAADAGSAAVTTDTTVTDTRAYRYISLDKVIVMLRSAGGEPAPHYIALDLVFMSPLESEKVTRDHLPMLRSVTLKALSDLTLEAASQLTVDELTRRINAAYTQTYARDRGGKPFAEAMVGKLIIE